MVVEGGGGALAVEFNMARIDDAAFFLLPLELLQPRVVQRFDHGRVWRTGSGSGIEFAWGSALACWYSPHSVAASPEAMLPKSMGYTP